MNNTLYQYRAFDLPVSWLGIFQQDQKVWTNKDLDFIDPGITLEFIGTDGDQFTLKREDHRPEPALKYVFKVLTQNLDQSDSEIVNHNSHFINALDESNSNNPEVIETTDQPISLNTSLRCSKARLIDVLDNQLNPLLVSILDEFDNCFYHPSEIAQSIDNLIGIINDIDRSI